HDDRSDPVLPDRHRPAAALAQSADQPAGTAGADPPADRPDGHDLLERQPDADVGAAQHDGGRGPARRQQPADAGDRRQRTGRVRHAGQGPGDRQERADAEDRFRQEITAPPGRRTCSAPPGLTDWNAAPVGGVFLCARSSRARAQRGGHRGRKGRCDMAFANQSMQQEQAQINITPLVDVLLVLLVIFMMTAPVLSRPIPLTLPQTAPPDAERLLPPDPVMLRIDSAGALSWNGSATSLSALPPLFAAMSAQAPGERPMLQIDAAGDSDYGTLARVLAAAKGAGVQDIGFVRRP